MKAFLKHVLGGIGRVGLRMGDIMLMRVSDQRHFPAGILSTPPSFQEETAGFHTPPGAYLDKRDFWDAYQDIQQAVKTEQKEMPLSLTR